MTIEKLIHDLDDMIVDCKKTIPFCTAEDGIRFFLPAPQSAAEGTVFAGSISEWKLLLENQLLIEGCTYLICRENDSRLPQSAPRTDMKCNCLFLNAPVQSVLQRLTALLTGYPLSQQSNLGQIYKDFWNDIITSKIISEKAILERTKRFPYSLKTHRACIVIKSDISAFYDNTVSEITTELQNFFQNQNVCFTEKEWIILYTQQKDTSDLLDFSYEAFSTLLEKHQLYAGISYVCRPLETLRTLYLTAAASIDLGLKISIRPHVRRIYTYHQINPYYVIHLCVSGFISKHNTDNLIFLTHPDITRLYYHDVENNNNLLNVLFAYLTCNQNLAHTSKELYMHRNTILNKLKKIETVIGHELDLDNDQFLLLLSCIIMKYQHAYSRKVTEYFNFEHINDTESP